MLVNWVSLLVAFVELEAADVALVDAAEAEAAAAEALDAALVACVPAVEALVDAAEAEAAALVACVPADVALVDAADAEVDAAEAEVDAAEALVDAADAPEGALAATLAGAGRLGEGVAGAAKTAGRRTSPDIRERRALSVSFEIPFSVSNTPVPFAAEDSKDSNTPSGFRAAPSSVRP